MLKIRYLVPLVIWGLILSVGGARVNAQAQNPIQNLRLSLNAGGQSLPSYTDADYGRTAFNAPIGTQTLYIVFEYTSSQPFDMRVKAYSPKGDPLLDRIITYPPASNKTESVELIYANGPFPDYAQYSPPLYLVNFYRGLGLTISDQFYFKFVSMTPTTTPSVTPGGSGTATETGTSTPTTPTATSTGTPQPNVTSTATSVPGQATATPTTVPTNNTPTPTVAQATATPVQGQTVVTATLPPNVTPTVPVPINTPVRVGGYPAPGQTGGNVTPQSVATVAGAPQPGVSQGGGSQGVPSAGVANPAGQVAGVSGSQGGQVVPAGNPASGAGSQSAVQAAIPPGVAGQPVAIVGSGQPAVDPNTGLPLANVPGSQEPFGTPLADFQVGTALPQNDPGSPLVSALATWVGALVAGGVALWLWRSRPQGTT
ncbi:MAG: hypothetical protein HY326_08615 [Chloroflexi bacterium]|nr:hypothetical protein [Chloroflexota bacterium]